MEITETDFDRVAGLAKLEFTAEEKKTYAGQLKSVLSWMTELDKADTAGVPPAAGAPGPASAAAGDVPEAFPGREELLKLAPAREAGFIKVPKVLA
ncbi:MAG: hypothetical protein A2X35_04485 [Elusimicrobia bacterium GWA2_61_42]|nr:MAG: hypothetical protein A2X35_04485 [Elusimicrobia bacterium GWA2_61_42]OGR76598.1 MAG: hypothetical protein A2X38_03400 [Elusimicrobia bacterium GWC2_61_25]